MRQQPRASMRSPHDRTSFARPGSGAPTLLVQHSDVVDARGIPLNGYNIYPLGDILAAERQTDINRFTNSIGGRYYPVSWLNLRANIGFDYQAGNNNFLVRDGEGPFGQISRQGSVANNRLETDLYTGDLGGTATFTKNRFSAKSSAGVQYLRSYQSATSASGTQLPPGATTVTAAAVKTASERTA